jgi:hypothetical protein
MENCPVETRDGQVLTKENHGLKEIFQKVKEKEGIVYKGRNSARSAPSQEMGMVGNKTRVSHSKTNMGLFSRKLVRA